MDSPAFPETQLGISARQRIDRGEGYPASKINQNGKLVGVVFLTGHEQVGDTISVQLCDGSGGFVESAGIVTAAEVPPNGTFYVTIAPV